MARKSQAQRLNECILLLAEYRDAGFSETEWGVKFLESVIQQMNRSRYPSKRQRDRIDAMVEEGVPTPKGDTELLAKMDAAVAYWSAANERQWECSVLRDMRRRVFNGWNMSEKQSKLLNDIIQRHNDDITGANVFIPAVDQRADLEILVKLYNGYSGQWRNERPAVRKAWERVNIFLDGRGNIEEYHYNKLMKAMGSKLRRVKNPRFRSMDLAKFAEREFVDGKWETTNHIITAVSDVYVEPLHGRIGNDFLMPTGLVQFVEAERVGKVRKLKAS